MHEGTAGVAAKGSIAAFIAAAIGVLVSFILQTTLARALGPTEYGTYVVILVWMNVLLLFTKVELDLVTTRFVGAYTATADWPRLHGLLRYVPWHVLVRTLVASVIGAFLLLGMRGTRFEHFVTAALMAVPLFTLTAQLLVRAAALQGFKRVLASQIPSVILRPGLLLVVVWALMLAGVHLSPAAAIGVNAIATAVAIVIAQKSLKRVTPAAAAAAPPVNDLRVWLRVGYGFVFISAAQLTLSQSSDVLLVAALLNRTEAAHYSVASQLAQLVAFASTAVMFIAAPLISELHAKGQMDTLRRFTRATISVCMTISFALLLAITVFGRTLLGIYGGAFRVAYSALLVLAVTQFISASIGALAGWLMTMTAHERPAAWIIGASAVLNIVLAIPLTLGFGLAGTATAALIATLSRSLMLSIYLRRHLGLLVVPGRFADIRA